MDLEQDASSLSPSSSSPPPQGLGVALVGLDLPRRQRKGVTRVHASVRRTSTDAPSGLYMMVTNTMPSEEQEETRSSRDLNSLPSRHAKTQTMHVNSLNEVLSPPPPRPHPIFLFSSSLRLSCSIPMRVSSPPSTLAAVSLCLPVSLCDCRKWRLACRFPCLKKESISSRHPFLVSPPLCHHQHYHRHHKQRPSHFTSLPHSSPRPRPWPLLIRDLTGFHLR